MEGEGHAPARRLERTRELLLRAVQCLDTREGVASSQGTSSGSSTVPAASHARPINLSSFLGGSSSAASSRPTTVPRIQPPGVISSATSVSDTAYSRSAFRNERDTLFNIRSTGCGGRKKARFSKVGAKRKSLSTWSHDFICLARTNQKRTPSVHEIARLVGAGLGKKHVSVLECGDSSDLHDELLNRFPALIQAGGYELLRVSACGRRDELELIPAPVQGHTPSYLKEVTKQAKIYIRPLQQDLSLSPLNSDLELVSLLIIIPCMHAFMYMHGHTMQMHNVDVIEYNKVSAYIYI